MKALPTALGALAVLASLLGSPASAATAAAAASGAACMGTIYNPITDTDWNNLYPIVIMGAPMGPPYAQSPLHFMPPICVCPGPFGIPSYGIGITYWQPLYVSEISRTAGCLSTLGGINVLPGFSSLSSEQSAPRNKVGDSVNRMQVHWYEYPVFALLDLFTSMTCMSLPEFSLAWMSEIDPTWQNDQWGIVFSPEAALFANPIAQAACSVDAVASSAGFTMDPLFWCAGTWGSVYPLTGNASENNSPFTMNNLIQAKFLARQHRIGTLWQTIGPSASCFPHPNPIWIKGQYRVDQVGPIPRYGMPVPIGSAALQQFPPVSNPPGFENTNNLIWQGQQCCLRAY